MKETCPDHPLMMASYERLELNQEKLAASIAEVGTKQTETSTEIRYLREGVGKVCNKLDRIIEERIADAKAESREAKAEVQGKKKSSLDTETVKAEISLKRISIIAAILSGAFGFFAPLMNALGAWILSIVKH